MIDLLRRSQSDKSAMGYVVTTKDQAQLRRADSIPIKAEDFPRMALIGGIKDCLLAKKQ